jgi:triphosphoribosyl-dephospho-CoA synthase
MESGFSISQPTTYPHSFSAAGDTSQTLARLAREALIAEAELTPKPGLVDRRGSGAHHDLSLDIMRRSACVIEPFFVEMAQTAAGHQPGQLLRERLAKIGRRAESAMFEATGGSNTHKGAIWALGLLLASASMHGTRSMRATAIAATAGRIAVYADRAAPVLVSHGQRVLRQYGISGAREEAQRGFPHVVQVGLPMLRRRRRTGVAESAARLDVLLCIMRQLNDTCLLYRGGKEALRTVQEGASGVLQAGGAATDSGMQQLLALDRELMAQHLSPGGSADLLAATLFLDAIERRWKASARQDDIVEVYSMELLEFDYPAKRKISHRAHIGVVGSGDLEVLLEPSPTESAHVRIRTTVDGFGDTWKAVLDRFFARYDGAAQIEINDAGATPGSVLFRLEQAVEMSEP